MEREREGEGEILVACCSFTDSPFSNCNLFNTDFMHVVHLRVEMLSVE